jgi:DNA-binding beta-propeller fold protein YncE
MNKTTRTNRCTKGLLLVFMATLLAVLALGVALNLVAAAQQGVRMYWTDVGHPILANGKIQRANLDGSNIQDLVTTGLTVPADIALDVAGGKMYWTNTALPPADSKIQRANLDGSTIEDLVTTGLTQPYGIALDVAGGKMYWTDAGNTGAADGRIQRADLDGPNIEDLVTTGITGPAGIALDVAGGKMYWADKDAAKIQRANLNGDNVEDLVTGVLSSPVGIALDVTAGKMYWTDAGLQGVTDGRIQRANLDGSIIEDLVTTGLTMPVGIALDVAAGKMYWADAGNNAVADGRIQRANLDGSTIEGLVTIGLTLPFGIALEFEQEHTLTVDKAGTGIGTVTSAPAGINRGADCTETYDGGTVVTLTATPDAKSDFIGWSGGCAGSDPTTTVTMNADKICTATFNLKQFTLTVNTVGVGGGTGTVTGAPAGIHCGADCTEVYDIDTLVSLTACPGVKSYLVSWSEDCVSTGALTAQVTMDADKTCTATFGYPVGGVVVPVDKVGLVAPWMGMVALAGIAALGVTLVRRRRG